MLSFDSLWWALLPPTLYFGIHLAEGETLTPILLARRFTLNPVLVILSLVFWFWMWGVPGAILAVPMLAILKIVSDRVRTTSAGRAGRRADVGVAGHESALAEIWPKSPHPVRWPPPTNDLADVPNIRRRQTTTPER
jgi:hypothetical protein